MFLLQIITGVDPDPDLQCSSYLSRGPRLVLWTAIHCNRFMHVLVHLKEMTRGRCYNYVSRGWKAKSPPCVWAQTVHFHSQIMVYLHSWLYRHVTASSGWLLENTRHSGPELLYASTNCITQKCYSKKACLQASYTCKQCVNLIILPTNIGEAMQLKILSNSLRPCNTKSLRNVKANQASEEENFDCQRRWEKISITALRMF